MTDCERAERIERAKVFVRDVLAASGQKLDEDTLNSVAIKVARTIPKIKAGASFPGRPDGER